MRAVSSFSPSRRAALQRTQMCLAISALLVPVWSFAAPVVGPNGGVTSGSANIVQNGAVTDINQSSAKAIINWQSFSTSPNETVNFNQPNAASITLNRVIGNEQSVLQGALNATGKVFLVNPNGVLISTGATVNTGGFVASTLNITDDDFNNGNYTFKGNGSTAAVTNLGTITVTDGGYVVLMGHLVSNQGAIVATKGMVSLNAGNKVTLNFNGNSLLSVTIDEGALNALVENKQAIYSDGGQVILTAKAADDLLGSQVNNTGIVQAQTIDDLKGTIEIYAHGGTANISGKLDASAPVSGDGGFIETGGDKVKIADSAQILTRSATAKNGKWLVDTVDFTIAASGGDMTGSFLSNYLNTQGDYEVKSVAGSRNGNGDIHVNDAIRWGSDNRLTLTAQRDININNAITLDGVDGGLTLNYGGDYNIRTKASYSGTELDANGKLVAKQDTSGGVYGSVTFTNTANKNGLEINGVTYTLIHSAAELDLLDGQDSITGKFYNPTTQAYDVSGAVRYMNPETQVYDLLTPAQSSVTWNYYNPVTRAYDLGDFKGTEKYYNVATGSYDLATAPSLAGRYALARDLDASGTRNTSVITSFNGTLAGMGHTISNLKIAEPYHADFLPVPTGLIGSANSETIIRDIGLLNVDVEAYGRVGALVGENNGGSIRQSYVTGLVAGSTNVGALVGFNGNGGVIANSFSTASVSGSSLYGFISFMGGLVGQNNGANSKILNSHVKTDLSIQTPPNNSNRNNGGLLGGNFFGTVSDSYFEGNLTASTNADSLGGLVGLNSGATAVIRASFANTKITGGYNAVGGLVGTNAGGLITDSLAIADITGGQNYSSQYFGGLVGVNASPLPPHGNISNSYAIGSITVTGNTAGGLVGNNAGSIADSYADVDVAVGVGGVAGGLAGLNSGTIIRSDAFGDASGETAGGIAGGNSGLIDQATAYGRANGTNASGEVAAVNVGTITNSRYRDVEKEAELKEAEIKEAAVLQARIAEATSQSGSLIQTAQQQNAAVATSTSFSQSPSSIDNQIVFVDTQNFSADVKSIVVDGVRFNLEDSSNAQDKESGK